MWWLILKKRVKLVHSSVTCQSTHKWAKQKISLSATLEHTSRIHALTNAVYHEHQVADIKWFVSRQGLVLIATTQPYSAWTTIAADVKCRQWVAFNMNRSVKSTSYYAIMVGDEHSAMRPHLASPLPAALTSSAVARQVQGGHPCEPDDVRACSTLPGTGLLPRHWRSSKKTALSWDSNASRQLDVDQHCARAVSAAGPRVWNYLPTDFKQPDLSYSHFKQSLKTFLFAQWDQSVES